MMLGSSAVNAYAIVFGVLMRFTAVGLPAAAVLAWVTAALGATLPSYKFVAWRARAAAAARAAVEAAASGGTADSTTSMDATMIANATRA